MAKKQDQLELLNAKFDKLIEVLLSQKSQSVEPKIAPTHNKEADFDVILTYETKSVQPKRVVSFFVDPMAMVTINGMPYEGNVTVEQEIATVIRRMLYEWERSKRRVMEDRIHPTRQHVISGKI